MTLQCTAYETRIAAEILANLPLGQWLEKHPEELGKTVHLLSQAFRKKAGSEQPVRGQDRCTSLKALTTALANTLQKFRPSDLNDSEQDLVRNVASEVLSQCGPSVDTIVLSAWLGSTGEALASSVSEQFISKIVSGLTSPKFYSMLESLRDIQDLAWLTENGSEQAKPNESNLTEVAKALEQHWGKIFNYVSKNPHAARSLADFFQSISQVSSDFRPETEQRLYELRGVTTSILPIFAKFLRQEPGEPTKPLSNDWFDYLGGLLAGMPRQQFDALQFLNSWLTTELEDENAYHLATIAEALVSNRNVDLASAAGILVIRHARGAGTIEKLRPCLNRAANDVRPRVLGALVREITRPLKQNLTSEFKEWCSQTTLLLNDDENAVVKAALRENASP